MIFHVTINSTEYEVEADSATASIVIALDTYGTAESNEPDQCLSSATSGLCVCAEYAGELVQEVVPAP